jgi:glycosyltransferase involved in cell wall biosynthesis
MPQVSVVTCTYNRAHLIGETIKSILSQTVQDFEYIIVDDGSSDHTEEVIKAFNDPRIKYFSRKRTGGHLSKLRNFAHQHCTGEFIAYIDSDDLWASDKLEIQLQCVAANSNVGFSFTDIEIFNQEGTVRKTIYGKSGTYIGSVFTPMLENKLTICHTTLLLRKSCLEVTGPMDETMHSGDHDFVFFLSRHFNAFVVYRPMVRVRKHDQNSTSDQHLNLRLMSEHHRTLEKLFHLNLISKKEFKYSLGVTSYAFGIQLFPVKDWISAKKYFLLSLKKQPFHIKSWLRLIYTSTREIFRF